MIGELNWTVNGLFNECNTVWLLDLFEFVPTKLEYQMTIPFQSYTLLQNTSTSVALRYESSSSNVEKKTYL